MTDKPNLARLLDGVPRYSASALMMTLDGCKAQPSPEGPYVRYADVLAALSSALPADVAGVVEKAGKVRDDLVLCLNGSDRALEDAVDSLDALISLATAQAAQIAGLEKRAAHAEAFRNPIIGDWWREQEKRAEAAETALAAERAKTARLVEAGKDAADDWEECLGHVASALGEKPDWYGHEAQSIADFRAALSEAEARDE